jgi:outer membrane protein OmpA-like peptidoglycan-associated protein/Tol biopolymer transport system component
MLIRLSTLGFAATLLCLSASAQVRRSVGAPLNTTTYTEYAPSVSANEKTLIYETDRGPNGRWELYFSTKTDKGRWNQPKPLTKVNAMGKENDLIGGPSISYDGQTLYFFASFDGGKGDMDLYECTREGDDWSEPKNLGGPINTARYEGFPSISPDGKKLYFIRDNFSKRKDKEICYSIWMAERAEDGTWKEPTQLPAPINSGCEKSPRIMADGRTLLFSSVRPGGMGSFDLYQSFQEDDGTWTAPENLSYINTDVSDQFASVNGRGDLMYYQNSGDIFTVTIPDKFRKYKLVNLDGKLIDAVTKKPLSTRVTAKSSNAKERPTVVTTPADGAIAMVLRVGNTYQFGAALPGYLPLNQALDLTTAKEGENLEKTFELVPTKLPFEFEAYDKVSKVVLKEPKVKIIEAETKTPIEVTMDGAKAVAVLDLGKTYRFAASATGYKFFVRPLKVDTADASRSRLKRVPLELLKKDEAVVLENITFETGSADLKTESFDELDEVLQLLNANPKVALEISAHTDDVGSDDSNLKLSDRRAKSVVKYLTDKGVETKRLVAKGYGETQPLAANDSDESRAKNRRVQFKLLN